jgi:preprotein translocase subunit SecF
MEILKNPNYDFLGKAKYFIALSLFFIAAGAAVMTTRGISWGVEFSGGTQLILHFKNAPEVDKIREAVDKTGAGAVIQIYGEASQNKVLVRIGQEAPESDLDAPARAVRDALGRSYGQNPVLESSSEIVGPIVGGELRKKAAYLTVLGLLFQLIYIAARFRGGAWGVAAAVAGLHDILICMGFLTFFHYEITLNVIAALLTLVGYSVNDTIVVFDRVRENLAKRRKDPLPAILNDSMNQTLTRTLISNGTTFLAVLGLYLFGGEVLRGFGFTMVVGVLVGTYSTVFIAVPFVNWWYGRRGGYEAAPAPAVKSGNSNKTGNKAKAIA